MKRKQYRSIKAHKLTKYRAKWHKQQNEECPLLKQKVPFEQTAVDHKHKRKDDPIGGPEGLGLIRGVVHLQANSLEGKISSAYRRYGLHKFIDLPSFLRNLADYLEDPPLLRKKIIHPTEQPKPKKLGKREFNKLRKYWFELYPNKTKLIEYPKSGKPTKQIKEGLEKLEEYLK